MNLEQLQAERRRTGLLVDRMNALKHVVSTDREGEVISAAQQALGMVNSERGMLMVKSLIAALIAALVAEEVASLAEAGAEFTMHDYFPEVIFSQQAIRDREEGRPSTFVEVAPGAEASIVRALRQVGSIGGEYDFDERGGIRFAVAQKQVELPEVSSVKITTEPYKLGVHKGSQE